MKKILWVGVLLLASGARAFAASEKVSFVSADGVRLQGEFFRPASPNGKSIVLLHGLASVRNEWNGFAELLQSEGFGVLAYDQRGHGESTKKEDGSTVDFQYFFGQGLASEWGRMIDDLGESVQFAKKRYPDCAQSVAVGGASIGANIAFRYAASHPETPCAVLLSPGASYQGISTDDAMESYGARPLLMAACPSDTYAYRSVLELKDLYKGSRVSAVIEPSGAGHGVQMFRRGPGGKPSSLEKKIASWLEAQTFSVPKPREARP